MTEWSGRYPYSYSLPITLITSDPLGPLFWIPEAGILSVWKEDAGGYLTGFLAI